VREEGSVTPFILILKYLHICDILFLVESFCLHLKVRDTVV